MQIVATSHLIVAVAAFSTFAKTLLLLGIKNSENTTPLAHCWSKAEYDAFDKRANEILDDERFKEEDVDILDFLFQTDEEGSISHKTCKKIYDLIKDIDFGGKIFTYAIHSDGKDYEHFKEFLLECYKHRRKMRWY